MTDQPASKRATVRAGRDVLEIATSDTIQSVAADVIVEARNTGMGTIALGFGTVRATGLNSVVNVLVCVRIRMAIGTARDLRATLDNVLDGAHHPIGERH